MALLKKVFILFILLSIVPGVYAFGDASAGRTTWANSTAGAGFESDKAVDRNTATFWSSADSINGYWGVDLGTNLTIAYISIYSVSGDVADIHINGSNDNVTYTQIYANAAYLLTSPTSQNVTVNANYRYINITLHGVSSALLNEVYVYTYEPLLIYPVNASTTSMVFPPLTTNVDFNWSQDSVLSSNLIISKDINFNVIEADVTTTNNFSTQALEAGTHYWKVRYYNSTTGTYYNYSNYSYFTITSTSAATGTGIDGVVYEFIGTVKVPVSGATVYLYNATFSTTTLTGSNGYYLFSGLVNNSTYQVYASKQGYDTTATLPATTGAGNITHNDILMKIFISPYIPNFVFEKFSVRSLFDKPYPGVSVSVFKGNDVIASFTGTTDSMGQVTFQLIKDTYYRAEFSGGGLPNTIIVYFYGKEEEYLVSIITGFPDTDNMQNDINATLTVFPFNSTFSNLSVVYNDTRNSTTALNFYATNLTTNVTCTVTSTSSNTTLNCTVLAAGTYRFGFNATSTIYGFFQQDKIINFGAGNTSVPQLGLSGKVSSELLHWTSIIILIFLAAFFSIKTVKFGAVIVPFVAMVMWWVGTLQVNFILLSIAMVLGIMVYLRSQEVKMVY